MDDNTTPPPEPPQDEPVESGGVIWDNNAATGYPVGRMEARRRPKHGD
jgi:hypothetical protein